MTETLVRRKPSRSAWVRRLVLLAVSGVITFVVVRLVGAIDWAEVWDALSHLSWWQPIVLLARTVRLAVGEELDLVELVHAEHALRVLARCAGLAPEAG